MNLDSSKEDELLKDAFGFSNHAKSAELGQGDEANKNHLDIFQPFGNIWYISLYIYVFSLKWLKRNHHFNETAVAAKLI